MDYHLTFLQALLRISGPKSECELFADCDFWNQRIPPFPTFPFAMGSDIQKPYP